MRECRTYGSVRGVRSNAHSYRNSDRYEDLITLMRALRDLLSTEPDMPTYDDVYKSAETAYEDVQAKLRDSGELPPDLEEVA